MYTSMSLLYRGTFLCNARQVYNFYIPELSPCGLDLAIKSQYKQQNKVLFSLQCHKSMLPNTLNCNLRKIYPVKANLMKVYQIYQGYKKYVSLEIQSC